MAGRTWDLEFNPVGSDRMTPQPHLPTPGSKVQLTPVAPGQRRSPLYAHVSDAEGNPLGLVLKRSLMRTSSRAGGNRQPEATDRTAGIFNDRRSGA